MFISQRKLSTTRPRCTYGLAIDRPWKTEDGMNRMTLSLEEGVIVENAFRPLVFKNDEYEEGHSQEFQFVVPANARKVTFYLFASETRFPRFVYQEDGVTLQKGIYLVKHFDIDIASPSTLNRTFTLKLEYHSHGIDLFYNDPGTGQYIKMFVSTMETDVASVRQSHSVNEQKESSEGNANQSGKSLGLFRRLFEFVAQLVQPTQVLYKQHCLR